MAQSGDATEPARDLNPPAARRARRDGHLPVHEVPDAALVDDGDDGNQGHWSEKGVMLAQNDASWPMHSSGDAAAKG